MIKSLLKNKFVRFLLVGGLNTVFGYLVFSAVLYFVKNLYASIVIANIIAVMFNFKTYGKLVFQSEDKSRVFRFILVYVLVIGTQMVSIKGLGYFFQINNTYLAAGIVTLPIALMSFVLMRKFVFHTTNVIPA